MVLQYTRGEATGEYIGPVRQRLVNDIMPNTGAFIHIGLPKTATTTLQGRLFERHRQIYYLGRNPGRERAYLDPAHAELATSLRLGSASSATLAALQDQVAAYRSGAGDRSLVWSDEGASSGSPDHRRKFLDHVGTVFKDVRIIITLRHPLQFVQSQYWQSVCRTQTLKFEPLPGEAITFPPIDRWIEDQKQRPDSGELVYLDYAKTIALARERFGPDNVAVLLYEHAADDFDSFVVRICEFIGIDADEGRRLVAGYRLASRVGWKTVRRVERLAASEERTSNFFSMDRDSRRRAIADSLDTPAPGSERAHSEISEQLKVEIEDVTREGNRWLVKELDLPLQRFGYPL